MAQENRSVNPKKYEFWAGSSMCFFDVSENLIRFKGVIGSILQGKKIDLAKTVQLESTIRAKQDGERREAHELMLEIVDLRRKARDSIRQLK